MDLTLINNAIESAYNSALENPQEVAATQVGDNANQTVQTLLYQAPTGPGFRVIGKIRVGNYSIVRVKNHGPDVESERAWPAEGIEANIDNYIQNCIKTGEDIVEKAGYSASRLVTCMDLLMRVREAGALESHPKLLSLYTWLQTVKTMSLIGDFTFPSCPYTFSEIVLE